MVNTPLVAGGGARTASRPDIYLGPSWTKIAVRDRVVFTGLSASPAAHRKFAEIVRGATEIELSRGVSHADLQRLFDRPELMDLAVTLADGKATIGRPPRPDELYGRLDQEFAVRPLKALRSLAGLQNRLTPEEMTALLSDNLERVSALFTAQQTTPEDAAPADFDRLLGLLGRLGNHKLNGAFVEEFTGNAHYGPACVEGLLLFLRERFPGEPAYQIADGDFNLEAASLFHARDAFAEALKSVPHYERLKRNIKEIDRTIAGEAAARRARLRDEAAALWRPCARGDFEAASRLCDLALRQPDDFFGLLDSAPAFAANPAVNLLVFDTLEAVTAARPHLAGAEGGWRRLGDEVITGILWQMAKGQSVNRARILMVGREAAEIEYIPDDLLVKLGEAGRDGANRHKEVCRLIYEAYSGIDEHRRTAEASYRDGKLDAALAELRELRRRSPFDDTLQHNIAVVLTQRGEMALEAGYPEEGRRYFDEALSHDQECIPAWNFLMRLALEADDLDTAVGLTDKMMAIIRVQLRGEYQGFFRQLSGKVLNNRGAILLQRFLKNEITDDLARAEKDLRQALEFDAANANARYNLAKVRLFQGDLGPLLAWWEPVVEGKAADIETMADLADALWQYFSRFAPEPYRTKHVPFFRTVIAYVKGIAREMSSDQGAKRTAKKIVFSLSQISKAAA